ncbi:hypothetical protein J2X65_004894 [Ancylobacter sp. 3268]|uniref:hypothetical protein n=1 Tax=Ancylobacter sp. 3268 TaxID=2817752 RepID=UPI00285455BD|nr:hypothetical protein [Ancylobacter sp. 3268]MDR6955514.1 hypothetical protein [Ancylobacter sp. 3268]
MATSSFLTDVEAALGMAVTLDYASKAQQHDLYEAYVLTLLLQAAHNEGWTVELRDGLGSTVTSAVFRLGPGRLPSRGYTFAHMSKSGKPDLEAHLGVKVSGRTPIGVSPATGSGRLLHEFDLLVLPATDANACRTGNADPGHSVVVVHAEMKYFGGKLPLPVGRASVGMVVECALTGKSVLVTNQLGYTVQDLVEHHGVTFRYRVLPGNPKAEYHLVQRFRSLL